jgi:molybdopterin-biosynthesis enzyme MoeA-like protein
MIFELHIMPLVKERVGIFVKQEINYNVRGVSEAMIAPALAKVVKSHPRQAIYLKTHPRGYLRKKIPQIKVQIISYGSDEKKVKKRLDSVAKTIEKEVSKLGGKMCE